ncbi:hypothetical protein PIB19_17245 [Sphingomonas sp. 7/4-4]|nr:hypothetical protein [Sphingomonas sp. 7/4-4]WBY07139.1 hypothetical protein PIB19_17245 [Sphingomonas sp. 7/4-4]
MARRRIPAVKSDVREFVTPEGSISACISAAWANAPGRSCSTC